MFLLSHHLPTLTKTSRSFLWEMIMMGDLLQGSLNLTGIELAIKKNALGFAFDVKSNGNRSELSIYLFLFF